MHTHTMSVTVARTDPFGTLGAEIKRDVHERDLDAKIIITSHNSRPGLGKTTLAIKMAREFDRREWDAHTKSFMDAAEYHQAYDDLPSGSALVFDEIEDEADNRRSMSKKNVRLSQAWAQNRYRNMITICTLPTVSMLDKRMLELSDYWINVMQRGVAHPYRIRVNDFTGKVYRQRIDENGVIRYSDLPDGDEDYELLKAEKDRRRTVRQQHYTQDELDKEVKKATEKAQKACRDEWIKSIYEQTEMSIRDIASLDACDVKYRRVGAIINGAS